MKKNFILLVSIFSLCLLTSCGGSGNQTSTSANHFLVMSVTNIVTLGTPFNITVTALDPSNGVVTTYSGTVHFSSSDSQAVLPANSTLTNGAGTFSVTLKTAGAQTVTATDTATGISGTSGSISVIGAATHLSVTAPGSATTGTAFNFTVSALDASNNIVTNYSGTVHFTSSDNHAVLPANSTLTNGTGIFSATLNTAAAQTITATDTVTVSITGTSNAVTASGGIQITSGPLPGGTFGVRYGTSHTVKATGGRTFEAQFFQLTANTGSPSWGWAAAAGSSLPPGLYCCTLTVGTTFPPVHGFVNGAIYGILTASGTFQVVVSVSGSGSQGSATYSVTIAPPPPPTINPTPPAIGTVNSPYPGFQFTATGGQPPLAWSETGALPAGLQLNPSGLLSGTPTTDGSFPITVMAKDSANQNSAPQAFTIQVLAQGFALTGSMETERVWHTATLLQDGNVLVSGGANNTELSTTAEFYDPTTKVFTQTTGSPTTPRTNATATLLASGKVLITGGKGGGGELGTADLYDPASETFAATTTTMSTSRAYHTATLLSDGTVLVTGGLNLAGDSSGTPVASAEIYNPTTDSFTVTGPMTTGRFFHMATLLGNGMVLITGGLNEGGPLASAEIYDPATMTFAATGTMTTVRMGHTATLLGNANVLIAGGAASFGGAATNAAELFDPAAGTFTATNPMTAAHSTHTATLLQNGQVLIAGGASAFYASGQINTISTVELFDPTTGDFTATADMTSVRESHTATLLSSGEVLVAGGSVGTLGYSTATTVLASAELYH
jgi:hypothetical protein